MGVVASPRDEFTDPKHTTNSPEASNRPRPMVPRAQGAGRRYLETLGTPAAALIFLIAVWQAVTVVFAIPPYLLPGPFHMVVGAWDARDDLVAALASTFKDALLGFLFSVIVGVLLGMLLALSRTLYRGFYPYAVLLQTIPIVTIAPIIIILFGTGDIAIVTISFIIAVFPVISNATLGLTAVDHNLINLFQMYNASPWQQLIKMRLPSALPYLLAGLRISSGLAVIGTVIGEFFAGSGGSDGGLGYIIQVAQNRMLMDELYAAALLSALLGVAVFAVVGSVGYLTLHKWHESSMQREN